MGDVSVIDMTMRFLERLAANDFRPSTLRLSVLPADLRKIREELVIKGYDAASESGTITLTHDELGTSMVFWSPSHGK